MGFWNSLTLQGKIAIAAGILGGLFLLSLAYGGNEPRRDTGPGFSGTVVIGQALFATNTPVFRVDVPTAVGSPTVVPTETPATPGPTATVAPAATRAPTATPVVVEDEPAPPPPPPPPPTATTATGCVVSATISGNDTATGRLTCAGTPVGIGAPMTATFNFANLSSGCSSVSSTGGTATCTVRLNADPGELRSVDVCMTGTQGRVCTTVR